MEAWLGVEECKARHNCSANRACKRLTLNFLTAGTPATNRDYAITKETLRSLYQRAVRLLKAERDERADLIRSMRAIGASSPQEHAPLPLATYCQEQLKYRLQSS